MFLCDTCKKPIGPKKSPLLMVKEVRPTIYEHFTEEGEVIVTNGYETVKEVKLCRSCGGASELGAQAPPDFPMIMAGALGRFDHAGRCKKPLGDCAVCKFNIEWFASLPLGILGKVLGTNRVKAS